MHLKRGCGGKKKFERARYMRLTYRRPVRKCGNAGVSPIDRVERLRNRQRVLLRHHRISNQLPVGSLILFWIELNVTSDQVRQIWDYDDSVRPNRTVQRIVLRAFGNDGSPALGPRTAVGWAPELAFRFFLILRRPRRKIYTVYLVGVVDRRNLARLEESVREPILGTLVNRRWTATRLRATFGDTVVQCRYVVSRHLDWGDDILIQLGEMYLVESILGDCETEFADSDGLEPRATRGRPPKLIMKSAESILGVRAHSVKPPELKVRDSIQVWSFPDRPVLDVDKRHGTRKH